MVVVVLRGGQVEVVALDAAGEAGVAAFPVEGVVGEDEGLVEGGALGFVEGGGVPVGEVPGFGVGEGDHQPAPSAVGGLDAPGVEVDAGDGGPGAVEDGDAVVIAGGQDVVADGEAPLADGNVFAEETGLREAAASAVVEIVDVASS